MEHMKETNKRIRGLMNEEGIDVIGEKLQNLAEDKTEFMMAKEVILMAKQFYRLMVKHFPRLVDEYKDGEPVLNTERVDQAVENEAYNVLNNPAYFIELGYSSHEKFLFQRLAMYEGMILEGIDEVPEFREWANSKVKKGKELVEKMKRMLKSEESNGKEPGFDEEFDKQYDEWYDENHGNKKGGNYDA